MNTLRNQKWARWGQSGLARLRIPHPRRPAGDRRAAPQPRSQPAAGGQPIARMPRSEQAAIYWRRRVVALLIGLAVLALIAWAFSGAVGGSGSPAGASGTSQPTVGHGAHGGAAQGGGPARAGHGAAGAAASAAGPQAGATAASSGQRGTAGPRPCPDGDVVLSLSTSQQNYTTGQLPQFNVDVVATAGQTCTFNVGARHVALIISAGRVRVWDSADCVQGAGDLVSDLQRGVPTVLPISWNRQPSSKGCPASSAQQHAGTYTAVVSDGRLASNSVTFRIS
jgi:hypothetical protein